MQANIWHTKPYQNDHHLHIKSLQGQTLANVSHAISMGTSEPLKMSH